MLVSRYSLRLYRPRCRTDSELLSAFGLVSVDLTPVIPYLNAVIRGAVYSARVPSLTFYRDGHMITIQPRQIGVSKCRDEQEARELLDGLLELINDTWDRREEIEPRYDEVPPLTVLEVYRLLPGANCGRCDHPTCLAFAADLVSAQARVEMCAPLFEEAGNRDRARRLLEALVARGYEVPDECL